MKRRRSQVKRENQEKKQRAKLRRFSEMARVSLSGFQALLLLCGVLLGVAAYMVLAFRSQDLEATSIMVWNKSFWCLFGGMGTLAYLVLAVLAFRKWAHSKVVAVFMVVFGFLGIWPVFTGSQLVARAYNQQPLSVERTFSPHKILKLYERRGRYHRLTGIANRVIVEVTGQRVILPISERISRAVTEGGCLDLAVQEGRLGFVYVADYRLPADLRTRVKCSVDTQSIRQQGHRCPKQCGGLPPVATDRLDHEGKLDRCRGGSRAKRGCCGAGIEQ